MNTFIRSSRAPEKRPTTPHGRPRLKTTDLEGRHASIDTDAEMQVNVAVWRYHSQYQST